MNTIATLIVDDEPLARQNLEALLRDEVDVEIRGRCGSAKEAGAALQRGGVDLVFLDIEMPGLSGLDLLRELDAAERPHVVFVTAYDEYAVQAFEVGAVDYLSKPFSRQRFQQTLQRVRAVLGSQDRGRLVTQIDEVVAHLQRMRPAMAGGVGEKEQSSRGAVGSGTQDGKFSFKSDGEFHLVPVAEISWLETCGDYLKVHLGARSHLVRSTLLQMLAQLESSGFVRIHRSMAVNTTHIRKLWPEEYGEYSVELRDGTRLRASRTFMPGLRGLI